MIGFTLEIGWKLFAVAVLALIVFCPRGKGE